MAAGYLPVARRERGYACGREGMDTVLYGISIHFGERLGRLTLRERGSSGAEEDE